MNHTKAGVGGTMAYMSKTVVAVCAAMGVTGKTCCTEPCIRPHTGMARRMGLIGIHHPQEYQGAHAILFCSHAWPMPQNGRARDDGW